LVLRSVTRKLSVSLFVLAASSNVGRSGLTAASLNVSIRIEDRLRMKGTPQQGDLSDHVVYRKG
jgi:hypothetical protein